MGREMGQSFKREGIYVYLWLIHVEVWQKTAKFYKAIILQLKNKLILKKVQSKEILGVTDKFGLGVQTEAGQRLTVMPRECTGHSKHPFPTTQETTLQMDIIRWSILISDWLNSLQLKMEKFYTLRKTKPGADCGSDHELLIAVLVGCVINCSS